MKGTDYNTGVLVTQDHLNFTEDAKEESIKERFGAIIDFGIIDGLAVTGDASDLNITAGEAFTDFDRTNSTTGYGDIGERVYSPVSLTSLARQVTGANVNVFITYVEIHKDRQNDQVGTPFYTKKEDSFVITQLTDSELATWNSNPTTGVFVSDNLVHDTLQTDLTTLTDDELDDTFGSGNWDNTSIPGSLFVDVTVTQYNSIYLGTLNSSGTSIAATPSTIVRHTMYIKDSMINANVLDTVQHRSTEHSNGIYGSRHTALFCNIDATTTPDQIVITDLSTGEYAYMGGYKCNSGDIASSYLTITGSQFPAVAGDYYIYLYYDTVNGDFRTTMKIVTDTSLLVNPYYMILCKVYWDNIGAISAYNGDKRYDSTASVNPVIDLRIFGTLEAHNIGNTLLEITGANLLPNGNFESLEIDSSGDVDFSGWTPYSTTTLGFSSDSLRGKQSLVLPVGTVASFVVPYDKNTSYKAKVTVKGSGTTGTYQVFLLAFIGKDYKIYPDKHIGSFIFDSAIAKTTSWNESTFYFNRSISDEWTGASYITSYSFPTDIDLVKYMGIAITNSSGSDILIDNVQILDMQGLTATNTELNKLDGTGATVTAANLNSLTDGSTAGFLHYHLNPTGYFFGGNGPSGEIDALIFDTETAANPFASLVTSRDDPASVNSDHAGYITAGYNAGVLNTTEKYLFTTETASTVSGETLTTSKTAHAGANSKTYGYFAGGYDFSSTYYSDMDKFNFSTETYESMSSTLSLARASLSGVNSDLAAYFAYGADASGVSSLRNTTDKMVFSTETVTTPSNSNSARRSTAGANSNTSTSGNGIFAGGWTGASVLTDAIVGVSFSTDTSNSSTETLGTAKRDMAGVNSRRKEYFAGGYNVTSTAQNSIDDYDQAADLSVTLSATLSAARAFLTGVQSGGIS